MQLLLLDVIQDTIKKIQLFLIKVPYNVGYSVRVILKHMKERKLLIIREEQKILFLHPV